MQVEVTWATYASMALIVYYVGLWTLQAVLARTSRPRHAGALDISAPTSTPWHFYMLVPALNEERRHELVKMVHRLAEDGRVGVRNIRRECMKELKELVHAGEVGEDAERRAEEQLQKLTDEQVHQIDELLKHKEQEILEV